MSRRVRDRRTPREALTRVEDSARYSIMRIGLLRTSFLYGKLDQRSIDGELALCMQLPAQLSRRCYTILVVR